MIGVMRTAMSARGATLAIFCVAVVVASSFLAAAGRNGDFAVDLRRAFLPAAERVLHGHSPLPAPDSPVVASGQAYVYPPLTALVLAPVSWLPFWVVAVVTTLLLAAAVVGTLRLLGVSDPRCYAAAFLWGPVLAALQTANLTLLLGLALAAVWRWRDVPGRSGPALAAALAPKLFLWPLAIWALLTRRTRTAVVGIGLALLVTFVTWAAVGFDGLRDYPRLTHNLSRFEQDDAVTVYALARGLGVASHTAWALWLVVGLAVLVAGCVAAARGDEQRAFALLIAASLVLTPIVWLHYFAILLVPLAIARRRFDLTWLLPVVLIGASGTGNGGVARTALVLGVAAVVVGCSLVRQEPKEGGQPVLRRRTTTEAS